MKKVIKYLCLLLIAVLIAILVLKNGASADADSVTIKFSVENEAQVKSGDTINITVSAGDEVTSLETTITSSADEGVNCSINQENRTVTVSGSGSCTINVHYLAKDDPDAESYNIDETVSRTIYVYEEQEKQKELHLEPIELRDLNVNARGTINAKDEDGNPVNVRWEKDSSSTGDVSPASGNKTSSIAVTATNPGTVVINAYREDDESISATATITIAEEQQDDNWSLSANPKVLQVGGNETATISAKDSAGEKEVEWLTIEGEAEYVSKDKTTATVKLKDSATAGSSIKISAKADGEPKSVEISVVEKTPDPEPDKPTPVLTPEKTSLIAGGESTRITSSVPVDWSSDKPSVVAIAASSSDTQATVISGNAGKATITGTAKDGGKIAKVEITVNNNEQAAPTISPSGNIKVEVGRNVFLSANQSVSWASSNPSIATVSGDGTVTAKGVGEAKITATNKSGKSSSVTITVIQASGDSDDADGTNPDQGSVSTSTFAISPTKTQTLNIGDTLQIKVTKGSATSWKSSKPAVATVDNSGKVTANSAGTTIITATASDGSIAQVKVRVRDENGEVPDPDSESNTDVPSTGEASSELLIVLGAITFVIATFIFRKKTK